MYESCEGCSKQSGLKNNTCFAYRVTQCFHVNVYFLLNTKNQTSHVKAATDIVSHELCQIACSAVVGAALTWGLDKHGTRDHCPGKINVQTFDCHPWKSIAKEPMEQGNHMCCKTLIPKATARKVAMAYPRVPTNKDGTIEAFQPFAAAIPAAVVGPASKHHRSNTVLVSPYHAQGLTAMVHIYTAPIHILLHQEAHSSCHTRACESIPS